MFANPTAETLALAKTALANGTLQKSVTISTGLTYYDLQAPAKNLYPVITPLRNAIPRVSRPECGHRDQLEAGDLHSSAPATTPWAGCRKASARARCPTRPPTSRRAT